MWECGVVLQDRMKTGVVFFRTRQWIFGFPIRIGKYLTSLCNCYFLKDKSRPWSLLFFYILYSHSEVEGRRQLSCEYEESHEHFNKKNNYQSTNFAYLHKILLVFIGLYLLYSGARIVHSVVINLYPVNVENRMSS
jgi:hypothetical protein